MRGAAGRIGLLLTGLAVALGLAEVIVRAGGLAPEVVVVGQGRFRLSANPKIGYEPQPRVSVEGDPRDFNDYRGASNRLGYRDYDHPAANPRGHYRIVVLGDSIGAGLFVEDRDDVFPALVEHLLRTEKVKAEVINLSVSGYNTQQEVETLKDRGLVYRPGLVLLEYCLNDRGYDGGGIMPAMVALEMNARGIPRSRVLRPLLIHSALYRFLRYRALPSHGADATSYGQKEIERVSVDATEAYFQELGRLARERGFKVLVAVFPDFRNLTDYPFPYEHRRVRRLSREAGLEFLDLLPVFQECEKNTNGPIAFDRFHPTVPGHRCAAEAIAETIKLKILGQL
ncbi:MAG TPA: SGNH/GDSL hydrolase family protein [Candidatus Saccharimonadales bacterium]|nr:SGNH/GDSL hydrolase family protein [Candidatus Saccharimonadales bacterium]